MTIKFFFHFGIKWTKLDARILMQRTFDCTYTEQKFKENEILGRKTVFCLCTIRFEAILYA